LALAILDNDLTTALAAAARLALWSFGKKLHSSKLTDHLRPLQGRRAHVGSTREYILKGMAESWMVSATITDPSSGPQSLRRHNVACATLH
jgi:hypothetical protein